MPSRTDAEKFQREIHNRGAVGLTPPPRKKQGFSRGALLGVFQDILEILARACARKGSNTVEVRKIGDETALKTI